MMSERPVDSVQEKLWVAAQSEQLIGSSVFKPFVVLCGQSFIALGKIFFFTLLQLRLSIISLYESLT